LDGSASVFVPIGVSEVNQRYEGTNCVEFVPLVMGFEGNISLFLGGFSSAKVNHGGTEDTEVAPRKKVAFLIANRKLSRYVS
jgi:hypothetical protein